MLKRILIRLLLGKNKEYFDAVKIKENWYIVRLCPYVPAEEFISKMQEALQKQGLETQRGSTLSCGMADSRLMIIDL